MNLWKWVHISLCAAGRVPPVKRSIASGSAFFENPMSLLFMASTLCVLAALIIPRVAGLRARR